LFALFFGKPRMPEIPTVDSKHDCDSVICKNKLLSRYEFRDVLVPIKPGFINFEGNPTVDSALIPINNVEISRGAWGRHKNFWSYRSPGEQ